MTNTAVPRSAAEQALLDAALIELIERQISFNQVLGLKVRSLRPDLEVRFDMRPELVGHHHSGRLHGGVISATLDAVGGCRLVQAIGERHPFDSCAQVMQRYTKLGTIDLRVDFLRQGLGQYFIATVEVMRLGGRVGSTQMRLVNDQGVLIATAAAAYIVS